VCELRARHRLSQVQLAYRAGTSQQALSKIEHGVVSPSVETLARLAAAVGEELVLGHRQRVSLPSRPRSSLRWAAETSVR